MSSEVCPFCGKTYKRLKSHLPHCKAAANSKTLPTRHDAALDPTSPSQLVTSTTQPKAKKEKSTQTLSVPKSKKVSVESSAASESANTLPSLSVSSSSLPPSTKEKKPKLSEQIKTATISLISAQSPPAAVSKSKKKSLRALIEESKSKQVSDVSPEGTRSTPEDPLSASPPFLADPLSHSITAQTKTSPNKDSASQSTETNPKGDSKIKVSKVKKAAQSVSTTKDTSSFLDSNINLSSDKLHEKDNNMLLDNEDLPQNMFLKLGNGHQARITLQDVKATLRRANATRQSGRPSILSQIKPSDDLSSKIQPNSSLSVAPQDSVNSSTSTKPLPDQLPTTISQPLELKSAKRKSPKSQQVSLLPVKHDSSPQPGLISATAPLLLSQVSQAKSPPSTTSPSLTQLPSPHLFPRAPQTLAARVETSDGSLKKSSQFGIRKEDTAVNATKGTLTERRLGQVTLRELPEWLVCRAPSHPRDVVKMVQRGWQWYYSRYIDVRKGGVAGLGMLLAGYCVLSYVWSYPHIKRDRWRKYH